MYPTISGKLFLCIVLLVIPAACAPGIDAVATSTMQITDTATPAPTNTDLPTLTPTFEPTIPPTELPTATPTPVPFPGFSRIFEYYTAWVDQNMTFFYFLNADITGKVYGLVDSTHPFECEPDPKYPQHLICVSDYDKFNKSSLEFRFFSDEARTNNVLTKVYFTGLGDEPFVLPDNCEVEYRIYDGKCYYAYTCYTEFGAYSGDNIPYDGHFEGFSGPCR